MGDLRDIEKRVENGDIFQLLNDLKTLAVLENTPEAMANYEILIIGLIERIQERIVLKWYK